MGTFSSLSIGVSGLQAAQQALNVIAQNIANANTEGYSRQRVDQTSVQSTPNPGLYSGFQTAYSGVSVTGVERLKNAFLQAAADNAVGRQSAVQSQVDPLTAVQLSLNEPGDHGFQATLANFYNAWSDLSNTPNQPTAASQVLAAGAEVTSQLNGLSTSFAQQWTNQLTNLGGVVQQANDAAANVADLNYQIKSGGVGGQNVNNLKDARDLAVKKLSSLVGGVAYTGDDGQISVSVGGVSLVTASSSAKLSLGGGGSITVVGTDPPTLMIGNLAANPDLGQAAGLLSSLKTDLPALSAQLDGVADALRDAVNTVHNSGYTLAGDPGGDFFTGTGAGDLTVAVTSPDQIAVSSQSGAVDGSNATNIANLSINSKASAVLGGQPGPSALYQSFIAGLGTQIQGLNSALTAQTSIVSATQGAVDDDSGVSLDEELTNMLLYQRSYQASAKVITAADEMLQTLIGMV